MLPLPLTFELILPCMIVADYGLVYSAPRLALQHGSLLVVWHSTGVGGLK